MDMQFILNKNLGVAKELFYLLLVAYYRFIKSNSLKIILIVFKSTTAPSLSLFLKMDLLALLIEPKPFNENSLLFLPLPRSAIFLFSFCGKTISPHFLV